MYRVPCQPQTRVCTRTKLGELQPWMPLDEEMLQLTSKPTPPPAPRRQRSAVPIVVNPMSKWHLGKSETEFCEGRAQAVMK